MISLTRVRTPAAIHPHFRDQGRITRSLVLLRDQRAIRRGEREKHDFDSDVWKQAKDQLLAETFDKCAYCEAPTAVVSYGDVEHYRPKSKYWWLAYCADNYLVSCAICNQRFKRDEFPHRNAPLKEPTVRSNSTDAHLGNLSSILIPDPLDPAAVTNFTDRHNEERPLLLNPYFDPPESFFAWRADINIKEVELVPRPKNPVAQDYVGAAEEFFGLNRKQLLGFRYFIFESYLTHKRTLLDPGISAATRADNQQVIVNMTLPERPFAGMIRFFESVGQPEDWEAGGFFLQ